MWHRNKRLKSLLFFVKCLYHFCTTESRVRWLGAWRHFSICSWSIFRVSGLTPHRASAPLSFTASFSLCLPCSLHPVPQDLLNTAGCSPGEINVTERKGNVIGRQQQQCLKSPLTEPHSGVVAAEAISSHSGYLQVFQLFQEINLSHFVTFIQKYDTANAQCSVYVCAHRKIT